LLTTIAQLIKGQTAVIVDFDTDLIPLKLIEMGCLPGNSVELIAVAPLGDPLFLKINDCQLSIRVETAANIMVEIDKN
jgi:ferrous iron transport protein A